MTGKTTKVLRIVDGDRYEVNAKGRAWKPGDVKRAGPLVYIRSKVAGHTWGPGWRALLEVAGKLHAAATFGIFHKLLELAADQPAEWRWVVRDHQGTPVTSRELPGITGLSERQITRAMEVLTDKRVAWLEWVDSRILPDSPGNSRTLPTTESDTESDTESEVEQNNSSEPPSDSEQVVLEFPTVGGGAKTWALEQSKIDEYIESYPGVDVLAECRAARQWCVDNTAKRKTPRGMPKFLNGWLERNQNGGQGGQSPTPHDGMSEKERRGVEASRLWLEEKQQGGTT